MPLPQAVSEIQASRKCDTATVRQAVKDAHQLGDLDLRLRRSDGSTDDQLDRNFWIAAPWGGPDPDLVFENGGQIEAPARPRRGSMRRVPPMERCRIVVPRDNLDAFLKPSAPLRKAPPKKKRRKAKQPSRAGAPQSGIGTKLRYSQWRCSSKREARATRNIKPKSGEQTRT